MNFTIYPPDGRVRVSAPQTISDDALHKAINSKLAWIKKHQARLASNGSQDPMQYITGERHPYLGEPYPLEVIEQHGRPHVELADGSFKLYIRAGSDRAQRQHVLLEWYREQLKGLIPPLIARWEPVIGVQVAQWGIKRMKTRWGSCSIQARRIWLNLELARRPVDQLEYIVVHEMVHLLERLHNARFYAYLDGFLPGWRAIRRTLKAAPLGSRMEDS